MAEEQKTKEMRSEEEVRTEYVNLCRRQKGIWQTTTWVLVGILLLLGITFFYLRYRDGKAREAGTNAVDAETVKVCEELSERVKRFSKEGVPGYHATVTSLGETEYLALSYEEDGEPLFTLYYRNEYSVSGENVPSNMGLLLSNGKKTMELSMPYDLDGELAYLCPQVTTIHEKQYLMFYEYEEDVAVGVGGVCLDNFLELESKRFAEYMNGWFALIPGKAEGTVLLTTANGSNYLYEASAQVVEAARARGGQALTVGDHFTWQLTENGIAVDGLIYVESGAYYGVLSGTLVPRDGAFELEVNRYGAYVDFDFDDMEGDKINTPQTEYLEEPVVLSAGTNERLYLQRYEKVPNHSYDFSELTKEAGDHRFLKDASGTVISKLGIDVSKHQGEIDWEKVAEAGIEFAFIRVGYRGSREGSLYVDEYKDDNIKGALENGIPVGVYFYSQAITVEEAIAEAELVLEAIEGYDIELPVVFDTEYYESEFARGNATGREERTKIARAFCDHIRDAGYQPMVYASTRWSIMNIDRDALAEYPFWFAYYGDTVSYRYDFQVWQYSASGKVPGVSGDCDMNLWLGEWKPGK